ncbi:MAG: hypothetical protein JO019_02500, partial [Candidatus Kaiserbacteria bacterium]|nr:hypothetical protein [Candidatus Kaiserbacteria bacterium]
VNFLQTQSPDQFERVFHDWGLFVAISIILSLLLGAACIYCMARIYQVRLNEWARFKAAGQTVAARDVPKTQLRWNRVLEQIGSEDEREWRLAILEADIMLNELLDVLGYKGETMADKMKMVNRSQFRSIDAAWEAHGLRNRIAHQTLALPLEKRDARRAITQYESVFREFGFIE